jgi:hypothetical protein
MTIFAPLYEDVPELEDHLDYFKEDKTGSVIGSMIDTDNVRMIDSVMYKLFYPMKTHNRENCLMS